MASHQLLKTSEDSSPPPFVLHKVGAPAEKVQALVHARWATLSGGTATRWQPEHCRCQMVGGHDLE